MRSHMHARTWLAVAGAVVAATACGKKADTETSTPAVQAPAPPPAVASVRTIEIGRHMGPNNQIVDSTSTFGVRDTMYVTVTSENTPNGATMVAKWTYQTGETVDSMTQAVAKTDATNTTTVTQFQVAKKTPWPVGKYTVDVMLDGKNVGTRSVEVNTIAVKARKQ